MNISEANLSTFEVVADDWKRIELNVKQYILINQSINKILIKERLSHMFDYKLILFNMHDLFSPKHSSLGKFWFPKRQSLQGLWHSSSYNRQITVKDKLINIYLRKVYTCIKHVNYNMILWFRNIT